MNLTYKGGGGYQVQKVLEITITVPLREGANLKNTYLLSVISFLKDFFGKENKYI